MPECPMCENPCGPDSYLGTPGSEASYRCRACGCVFQDDPPSDDPSSDDDDAGGDDEITETLCADCGFHITDLDNPHPIGNGEFLCDDCHAARTEPDDPRDFPNPEVY